MALKGSPTCDCSLVSVSSSRIRTAVSSGTWNDGATARVLPASMTEANSPIAPVNFTRSSFIFPPISNFLFCRIQLFQLVHVGQIPVGACGFLGVDLADRKTDVDHNVLSNLRVRYVLETSVACNAAVVDAAHSHAR